MNKKLDKQLRRQERCMKRARKARFVAKLLFLVFPLLISAALWSDPEIAKELERGLEITKKMLNKDSEADESLTATAELEEKPRVGKLPTSQIKVNRLVGGKP